MTLTSVPEPVTEPAAPEQAAPARTEPPRAQRVAHGLAFDRIGAVYVWLGIIVLFSLWVPETFPNLATAKQILNANAITALAALSITIPLAARVFDLSFAGVITLTGVAVAHLIAKDGVPLVPAIALALALGLGNRGDQRGRGRRHADRLVHRHARDRAR